MEIVNANKSHSVLLPTAKDITKHYSLSCLNCHFLEKFSLSWEMYMPQDIWMLPSCAFEEMPSNCKSFFLYTLNYPLYLLGFIFYKTYSCIPLPFFYSTLNAVTSLIASHQQQEEQQEDGKKGEEKAWWWWRERGSKGGLKATVALLITDRKESENVWPIRWWSA